MAAFSILAAAAVPQLREVPTFLSGASKHVFYWMHVVP